MTGILREFNGTVYPLGFPETVAKHAESCVECQANGFTPFCEVGSAMLCTWLMGSFDKMMEDMSAIREESE